MRIGLGQILVIIILMLLLFGDIRSLKKQIYSFLEQIKNNFLKK